MTGNKISFASVLSTMHLYYNKNTLKISEECTEPGLNQTTLTIKKNILLFQLARRNFNHCTSKTPKKIEENSTTLSNDN